MLGESEIHGIGLVEHSGLIRHSKFRLYASGIFYPLEEYLLHLLYSATVLCRTQHLLPTILYFFLSTYVTCKSCIIGVVISP